MSKRNRKHTSPAESPNGIQLPFTPGELEAKKVIFLPRDDTGFIGEGQGTLVVGKATANGKRTLGIRVPLYSINSATKELVHTSDYFIRLTQSEADSLTKVSFRKEKAHFRCNEPLDESRATWGGAG